MAPNMGSDSTVDYIKHITGALIPDEEWSTPLEKISGLAKDDESWAEAREILEPPTAECHKIGDESRSLVARHIIDRLKEKQLLMKIEGQAPRLRSAVELLSKPDADYLQPVVRYLVDELRLKHSDTYSSVIQPVNIAIPIDELPANILVKLAKVLLEDNNGNIVMNWGKYIALLALAGALAVDSVESDYPEGVTEVVETFGCLAEQFMAPWILSPSGGKGWEALVKENVHPALLHPVLRTVIIICIVSVAVLGVGYLVYATIPYINYLFHSLLSQVWIQPNNDNELHETISQTFTKHSDL